MDEKQILLEEWKDIRETLRYFGNKRFAQLTVFIAASGFMIDAFLKQTSSQSRTVFPITGMLLAIAFLVLEVSAVRYWKAFVKRGEEIESKLPTLELMTHNRPSPTGLKILSTGTAATYTLYSVTFLYWALSFFLWR